jgi:malate dehydrogenase (oxaloacetate-decarboxylating)(NADP+)
MTDLNPMSSVDVQAIEAKMKMASLDQLRGYAQNHYGEVHQYTSTEYVPQSEAAGYQILREPIWNKGTFICMSAPMSASCPHVRIHHPPTFPIHPII